MINRKIILPVYLVYLAFCICVTAVSCGEKTDVYREELYGTTTDKKIKLKEGRAVSVDFTLTEDDLHGVGVKFQTKDRFGDEEMTAELTDVKTGSLLAKSTAVLRYERIQNKDGGSLIYFELPVKQAEGKDVRLTLSLNEDVRVIPSLVASENELNASSLRVGDKPSDLNLVFKTRYLTGEKSNVAAAAANGIFLALFGTLIFLFVYRRKEGGAVPEKTEKKRGRPGILFDRIRRQGAQKPALMRIFPGLLAVAGFVCFYIVYVYKCGVSYAILENDYFFLKGMYAVFAALVLLAALVISAACMIKRLPAEKLYALLAVILGVLMSLVISLDTVPDEPSHIDTAYALSNEILGIPESEKPGYIYKRVEDINADAEERQNLGVENYRWMHRNLYVKAKDASLAACAARSNLDNGGKIYYVPQALGIALGRIFGLSLLLTMMLGRFFSLLAYTALTYLAVKKIPFGKVSLMMIGILPISLQQAASMSYDGMINGIALLYIAYNIHMFYNEERITAGDIAVIALTGSLIAAVKGGAYLPLCFLPLMLLWTRKDLPKKERGFGAALTGLFLLMFVKDRLIGIISRLSVEQGAAIGGAKSQEVYTFGYLMAHPSRFIGLFANTFHKQGDLQLSNLLGGNLAWRDININWYIIIFILLLLLLSCIRQEKEKYIPRADKVYMGLVALGCFGLVEFSMLLVWTPVTLNFITGAQGRYFIPFFLLILLCLRNSFFSMKKNIERKLILLLAVTDITVILHVLLVALEKQ